MPTSKSGFTLVELMVSSTIILFAILAVLGAQTALTTSSIFSREQTQALQDAELVMETLRVRQYENPAMVLSTSVPTIPAGAATWGDWVRLVRGPDGMTLPSEIINVFLYQAGVGKYANLQRVRVDVNWSGSRLVKLVSMFAIRPVDS